VNARARAIVARLQKHGLKVCCLGCGWLGRQQECVGYPGNWTLKRVRDCRCPRCEGRVCSLSWATRNPAKYEVKAAEETRRLQPFRG